jgi:hypothetical protein
VRRRRATAVTIGLLAATAGWLAGQAGRDMSGVPAALAQQPGAAGVLAIVDSTQVTLEDLRPAMLELAGGEALADLVLDVRLADALKQQGLSVSEADVAAERALLEESVARVGGGENAVERLRSQRGLGEQRFASLLRRNAALRKLVTARGQVVVEQAMVDMAYAVRHGERLRLRLITTDTAQEAARLRAELEKAEPAVRRWRFAELALERSTDASGAAGGLIESLSPADSAYPAALREAVAGLSEGQLSAVIRLPGTAGAADSSALALLEARMPADGVARSQVDGELRRLVQRRQERLAMDALAVSLRSRPGVSVMDRSLGWSYRRISEDAAGR